MNPDLLNNTWALVQQNDQQAFDRIYHEYVQVIFATVYKHIDDRQDCEDLVQEVFLDLWDKRHTIQIRDSFFNYLYSIARYKTLRYIKEKQGRLHNLELVSLSADKESAVTVADAGAGLIARETEALMAKEIDALPGQMKRVYELYAEKNMSIAEIADDLLISPNTVKNHLAKVRKRLGQVLTKLISLWVALQGLLLPMLP